MRDILTVMRSGRPRGHDSRQSTSSKRHRRGRPLPTLMMRCVVALALLPAFVLVVTGARCDDYDD